MMTVGFMGLGAMGYHMAMNLCKKGAALTVTSSSAAKLEDFARAGAACVGDAAGLAACDVICLCLPGDAQVTQALTGPQGLLPLLRPGQTVIDFSTVERDTAVALAAACAAAGVEFVDAPVSGQEVRAADGTLAIYCGGRAEAFERVLPLLQCVGREILYMGGSGSGQLAKLINQLLYDISAAAVAEIFPMAVKLGLDPEQVARAVNSGTGRSHASEFFAPRILRGDLTGGGLPMERAYKDLVQAAKLSARENIPLPVLGVATATYQTALRQGYGGLSKGGMIRVYEELLGVQFRSAAAPHKDQD